MAEEQEHIDPDKWFEQLYESASKAGDDEDGILCLRHRMEVYFPMTHPRAPEAYARLHELPLNSE